MNLYLDTSSLVKLYIREIGTEAVQALASQTLVMNTSWLTYPEARAAFARKYRDGDLTHEEYGQVLTAFEQDWAKYLRLEVSFFILLRAGQLAERHSLKAAEAIHLASACYTAGLGWHSTSFLFVCHDGQLLKAARAEGLATQLG